jgi:hypothetical protein
MDFKIGEKKYDEKQGILTALIYDSPKDNY